MAMTSRRLRIAGAGLGALLVVGALIYVNRAPTTPAAQQAAVAWPIAPDQLPPKPAAQQPKPVQAAKEERQDYIVQAASVDLARRAVEKAGGVVTGDLSIIRPVGASLDAQELAKLNANPRRWLARLRRRGRYRERDRSARKLTTRKKSRRPTCTKADSRVAA